MLLEPWVHSPVLRFPDYKMVRLHSLQNSMCDPEQSPFLWASVPETGSLASFSSHPASTARHLYLRGGAGVGSMTKIYGGRQRNGVMPSHFSRGSKSVARRVLQALEGLKMVEKDQDG